MLQTWRGTLERPRSRSKPKRHGHAPQEVMVAKAEMLTILGFLLCFISFIRRVSVKVTFR